MFRIMIVDDEHIIRKGLINFIDWNALECEVVCEADNGILAKDLLYTKTPDIVIADIKMPGLDGLGLAGYIYKNCPSVKVILLTGYSDFEYAQSAIKFNVIDFVLKPSSTEKIIDSINKAKNIIIDEQIKENKLLNLENKLKENLQNMQEKFIQDLINGVFSSRLNIFKKIKQLKINLQNYYVLAYKVDTNTPFIANTALDRKVNILVEIKNFMSMIFKDFDHYTLIIDNNSLCTLISFSNNNSTQNMQYILNKSKKILNFVNNFINIAISIGISNMHTKPSDIQTAFTEAQKCLSYKFYDDSNIFIYSHYGEAAHDFIEKNINEYIDKIIKYVESVNSQEAVKKLHELFQYHKASRQPIEHIKTTAILICSLCSKLLNNHSLSFSDIISTSDNICEYILKCESIVKLSEILETIILSTVSSLNSINSQDNYIIKKAMNYINENYQNCIKLDILADYVHVNSCYLSRLFKKETGSTLTETIRRIRIEKAKELLISKNNKTYEIASMVGFEDPAYFSYVFKKYTGLSPNYYKKQNI